MSRQSLLRLSGQPKTLADCVRQACVLEATAPKPGNVQPDVSFVDLCFDDFVVAADIAATEMTRLEHSLGQRIKAVVRTTRLRTGTNVNLGIVLLMSPLVVASQRIASPTREGLQQQVSVVLGEIDRHESRRIYAAIAEANAGGLRLNNDCDARAMDAENPDADHDDLIAGMRAVADVDRIAAHYADGYVDLFETVVPVLESEFQDNADGLHAIVRSAVRLLAWQPDSLIVRKNGWEIARQVQDLARQTDLDDAAAIAELDRRLRSFDHRLNPGTTADLIAAGLFVLLAEILPH